MAKYMLLIYSDEKAWADLDESANDTLMGEYFAYTQALVDAGAFVAGEPLQGVATAKTVAQGGVVTDGPFAETAEALGGFYLIDVDDEAATIEWASRVPSVVRGLDRVEVRPLLVLPGM